MNGSLDQFKASLARRQNRLDKHARQFKDKNLYTSKQSHAALPKFTKSQIETVTQKIRKQQTQETKRQRLIYVLSFCIVLVILGVVYVFSFVY